MKVPVLLLVLSTLPIAPALAGDFEITPFAGVRWGGLDYPAGFACVAIAPPPADCPTRAESGDEVAWGIDAALAVRDPWWLEARISHQQGDLELRPGRHRPLDASWDRYLVGIERRWPGSDSWHPFAVAAAGWTDLEADAPTSGGPDVDLSRSTLELGTGLLVDLGSRLGLRLEARGSWTPLPQELGDDLVQIEATAGLRLRFPG